MKIKLFLSAFIFMLSISLAHASFPVKRTKTVTKTETVTNSEDVIASDEATSITMSTPAARAGKDKWVAAALWFVLGGFAGHRWYIGSPWYWNVLYIITFGFFFVGYIIDIVQILTDSYPGL